MPKIKSKLHLLLLDASGNVVKDEFLEESIAIERFYFYVQVLLELHSDIVKSVCLGSGNHVRYEFRDVRSIVDQRNLFPNV